jgi:hypothetical protein
MKLITQLSILLEDNRRWHEVALASEDMEDLADLLKLFGGGGDMWGQRGEGHFNSLQQLYKALEHKGLGDQFLTHIITHWNEQDNPLSVVLDAIGGAYNPDKDLLHKYVIPEAIDALNNLTYEDGKYILTLEPGEEADFYDSSSSNNVDCHAVAEQIWSEMGLEWEPYDANPDLDYLLENEMTEENIEALKQHLEKEYTNAEVSSFREEFDGWKEEDQIGEDDNAFFLYPERVRRLDPYNLAVLLESADELDDVKNEIKWAWGDAWNQGIMDNYYTTYHDEFYENVGASMGKGILQKHVYNSSEARYKPIDVEVSLYDVTPHAERTLLEYIDQTGDIDNSNFAEIMKHSDSTFPLCPNVDEYPHDDDEVTELFNERLQDYL